MRKKVILLVSLLCLPLVISFAFDYWTREITVENYNGRNVQRTAYFFSELRHLEQATGFPGGAFGKTRWEWAGPPTNYSSHDRIIYADMRRNNFRAAFVEVGSGTSVQGTPFWNYTIYLIRNGTEYFDMITRYNSPVRF